MVENEFQAQEREVNLVKEIKETVFAYWPLFVLGLAMAFMGAFLYLRYTIPTYQASAKVLVKDDSKTGFGGAARWHGHDGLFRHGGCGRYDHDPFDARNR
jgi:hypothetical protein